MADAGNLNLVRRSEEISEKNRKIAKIDNFHFEFEIFSRNSYVKTIKFQLFGSFSKNAKSNLRGDIFSPFLEICQGQALSLEKLTWSPSLATRPPES